MSPCEELSSALPVLPPDHGLELARGAPGGLASNAHEVPWGARRPVATSTPPRGPQRGQRPL
eukprot:3560571-Alexandrium_andersonii.AAC.1